jgi:hypothetical protein
MGKNWFEVDKEGLAKLLARRGKGFVVTELVQNSWDTNAKKVEVTLEPVEGRPLAQLTVVDDDPEGFADLTHAFTLFAESVKKGDPEKRGRFNLGEKLVLAICEEAQISTTKGTIKFDRQGRHSGRTHREKGSEFQALIRLTRSELAEVDKAVGMLIPPDGILTTYKGQAIPERHEILKFQMTLPIEIADVEGAIRRSARSTTVSVHEVKPDEKAHIYEMGIPIVETGDRWHYVIGQKVPLNADRDNVTPAYLQAVRTEVLNRIHDLITKEDATSSWVRDASADEMASKDAVEKVVTLRFGEKRVIADPSDPEGTKIAMSEGYTVIPPGALSGGEWANVKRHEVARPAGQVTPSPKPYSENGKPLNLIIEAAWTDGMRRIAGYVRAVARELLGHDIMVRIANEFNWPFGATYGGADLTLNLARLGRTWFDRSCRDAEVNELLIHEFGHEHAIDHLSSEYHRAVCLLGAKLMVLALEKPEIWKGNGR